MPMMLSAKDVAIRAIETGEYPHVYCPGCDAWVSYRDLHDGEHCPRCRGQVEEAKSFKLGLASLTPAEVETAEAVWREREALARLKDRALEKDSEQAGEAFARYADEVLAKLPADAQPVLKYGNKELRVPQTSAGGQGA